jgi:repressor LexA
MVRFIGEFLQENGIPPTVRDIQTACNISSTSVVDYNLRLLQRDGYLRRKPDVARGIELLDETGNPTSAVVRVPVVAYIAAGEPLPVLGADGWTGEEALETIDVPPEMLKGKRGLYALRVKGSSMIDALVDDGDIVLVEPSRQASNGAMVVARLRLENETTLKRLYQEGDRVRLQPANSQMDPIYSPASNVEVQGQVVGVIRILN